MTGGFVVYVVVISSICWIWPYSEERKKISYLYTPPKGGSGKKRICGCCVRVRAGVSVRVRIRVRDRITID